MVMIPVRLKVDSCCVRSVEVVDPQAVVSSVARWSCPRQAFPLSGPHSRYVILSQAARPAPTLPSDFSSTKIKTKTPR